jgi:heterotetrameric sarcosine oxidase gamma subunit
VADLIAKSPLSGRAPLTLGQATLSEVMLPRVTSVAPFKGQQKALAKALKGMGLVLPAPNAVSAGQGARLVWTGRDQAFLMGADPAPLAPHAALTDQSDGWAGLALEGAAAPDVLARVYALDLRAMAPGAVARSPLNHMSSLLLRTAPDRFEMLVFRSMARTAWHEVEAAMSAVAARGRLG